MDFAAGGIEGEDVGVRSSSVGKRTDDRMFPRDVESVVPLSALILGDAFLLGVEDRMHGVTRIRSAGLVTQCGPFLRM